MSGSEQALTAACRLVSPGGWISLLGISDAPETVDLTRDAPRALR